MAEITLDVDRDLIRRCWDNLTQHADDFALACNCPVAEAASRALGRPVSVTLENEGTPEQVCEIVEGHDFTPESKRIARVPDHVVPFILAFDREFYDAGSDGPKLPDPISFRIPRPASA